MATESATPANPNRVAARIADRALEARGAEYAEEIRRLLDAALLVMGRCGTETRPRVTDIVAAAGLSNEAFYRHFRSKDELVGAVLVDGAERLAGYLAHQMAKEREPAGQVRRWVAGVLAQAADDSAATTLAVLSNAGGVGGGIAAGRHPASGLLAGLLLEPFAALAGRGAESGAESGAEPALAASLVAHAVLGTLSDHLWARTPVTRAELARVTAFALAVPTLGSPGRP